MVLAEHDFDAFDLVVAVKEAEHRTMMQERFPKRMEQIEYWQIHDIDCAEPSEALVELEGKVRELVERLRTASA
jgi:protein-tyrosine phosphatase